MSIPAWQIVAVLGFLAVAFLALIVWGACACQDDPEDGYQ